MNCCTFSLIIPLAFLFLKKYAAPLLVPCIEVFLFFNSEKLLALFCMILFLLIFDSESMNCCTSFTHYTSRFSILKKICSPSFLTLQLGLFIFK